MNQNGNRLQAVDQPSKEKCQMAITELILTKVEENNQDCALQALSEAEKLSKSTFFAIIEPVQSWFVKWALMKYWVLVHQRR